MGIFRQWPTNQWRRACRYHYKEVTSYNNLRGGLSAYFYFTDDEAGLLTIYVHFFFFVKRLMLYLEEETHRQIITNSATYF